MEKESWSEYSSRIGKTAALGAATAAATEALNSWQPGSGAIVHFALAGLSVRDGDYLGVALNAAAGAATIYNSGALKQEDLQEEKQIPALEEKQIPELEEE